jgi:FkbM family methyltransferase
LIKQHNIDLIIDVGANTGQYVKSLRESNYSGRVISFEPLSSAHEKLVKSSEKDSLWEIATRTAIGDHDGQITINISNNSVSSSVLEMLDSHAKASPESVYLNSETVKISRLDTIAKEYINKYQSNSIFLKIYVQGFERQVIEGAKEILLLTKGIQLELSLIPLYKDQVLFEEMLEVLKKEGYQLYFIIPGFSDPETGRMLQMDGIFFKKDM